MTDLARDAVGILDVLGIERARVVAVSCAGGIGLSPPSASPPRSVFAGSGGRGCPHLLHVDDG